MWLQDSQTIYLVLKLFKIFQKDNLFLSDKLQKLFGFGYVLFPAWSYVESVHVKALKINPQVVNTCSRL